MRHPLCLACTLARATHSTGFFPSHDWRKILSAVFRQLWRKVQKNRTSGQTGPVCLMVDDTDFPKRGFQTELIGNIVDFREKAFSFFYALLISSAIQDRLWGATRPLAPRCFQV